MQNLSIAPKSEVVPIATRRKPVKNFPSWCKRTITSLSIESRVGFQEWAEALETADCNDRGRQWWIGDLLNRGEELFPEEWSQVLDPDEEQKREAEGRFETYQIYKQVAGRIPQPRRRGSLYFGHHQAVAYMESEEEQDFWLDTAEEQGLSVDKLRRKIRKAKTGDAEGEPALDIQVLQDPLIRQWLDEYRAIVTAHDDSLPKVAGATFLHRMCLAHSEQAERQLERTLAIDCGVVKRAVGVMLSAPVEDIERCMRIRGFFMSRADLLDRLQLLIDLGEIRKEKAEDQRVANARGDVVYEYKVVRKPGQPETDDDDEDKRW